MFVNVEWEAQRMLGLRDVGEFRREVEMEIVYLTKLHGDEALVVARSKAVRPNQRSARRKVLEAVVHKLEHRLEPQRKKIFGLFG